MTAPFLMCWEYLTRYDRIQGHNYTMEPFATLTIKGVPHYKNVLDTPALKRFKHIAAHFIQFIKRFIAWKRPVVDKCTRRIIDESAYVNSAFRGHPQALDSR